MEKNKDEIIEDLLKVVEEKKDKIKKIKNFKFKTSLSFTFGMNTSESRNLNTVTTEELYRILLFITDLIEKNEEFKDLGLDGLKDWYGYSLNDWKEDVILKIKQKEINNEVSKLKVIESKLNSLISEDKRKELELKEIIKSLDS